MVESHPVKIDGAETLTCGLGNVEFATPRFRISHTISYKLQRGSCGRGICENQDLRNDLLHPASRKPANLQKGGFLAEKSSFPLNSWIDLIIQAITDLANIPYNLVQNALLGKHT